MDWLRRAGAAGHKDVAHPARETDTDVLRDRHDFKKLLAELEANQK
jgi:hypothetical protein